MQTFETGLLFLKTTHSVKRRKIAERTLTVPSCPPHGKMRFFRLLSWPKCSCLRHRSHLRWQSKIKTVHKHLYLSRHFMATLTGDADTADA